MDLRLDEIVGHWENFGTLPDNIVEQLNSDESTLLSELQDTIEEAVKSEDSEQAVAAFSYLNSTINLYSVAAAKRPAIGKRIGNFAAKHRTTLSALGKKLGAKQLTIQVGTPFVLRISLTWNLP